MTNSYDAYMQSPEWQKRRDRFLARHNQCFVCNSREDLEVHHKSYARLGSEYDRDLATLCKKHHQELHAKNLPLSSGIVILKQQWLGRSSGQQVFLGVPATQGKNQRRNKAKRDRRRKRRGKEAGRWLAVYPDPNSPKKFQHTKRLGTFKTAEAAARAHDVAALNDGAFDSLNFPASCYEQTENGTWYDPRRGKPKEVTSGRGGGITRYRVDPKLLEGKSSSELNEVIACIKGGRV
jgi:hypothetical protein